MLEHRQVKCHNKVTFVLNRSYKMNEIVKKLLFKKSGFTYSACAPFTNNKEQIQKSGD